MFCKSWFWLAALAALQVMAQDPANLLAAAQGNPGGPGSGTLSPALAPAQDAIPGGMTGSLLSRPDQPDNKDFQQLQNERADREIRLAKAREKGPLRFAADLFETRQYGANPTDGGIAEDYVLGVGDRLQMSVFGSATFDLPLQVDGRGEVVIPKVGTVPVAGLTLGRARTAVQDRVARIFSRSTVDVSVTKLREVRVFVLGEVYRPGSFLVPSLSSVINVLSLAGGPTAVGSYRDIRVLRGGTQVHAVDLYPLRAEGLGNINFGFQNGDTLFVPLVRNQVQMEGGFARVVATVPVNGKDQEPPGESPEEMNTRRLINQTRARLELPLEKPDGEKGSQVGKRKDEATGAQETEEQPAAALPAGFRAKAKAKAKAGTATNPAEVEPGPPLTPSERAELEENLVRLEQHLREIKSHARGDQRIWTKGTVRPDEFRGQPRWLKEWLQEGKAPVMQFEMLPGETVKDALRFAGGFALEAFSGSLTLQRLTPSGALTVMDVPAGEGMAACVLQKGDVLTALPARDFKEGAVTIRGWARVQGLVARKPGQRVGDLLKDLGLVLPDTYLERGELVHTRPDGRRSYRSFDVGKAMAGDGVHNLPLENRDEIELYRISDLDQPRTLTVLGPVSRPGTFEFIEGMRASDLLFRAGVPLDRADRFVAELAHTGRGKDSVVQRLDLARLLSREDSSPVDLEDDRVNPRLLPFDQLSIFEKPDFRLHRSVRLSGQVVRPGIYELESQRTSLRDVLKRAGGLTPEAMPSGGIFLRSLDGDPEKSRANSRAGVMDSDPTSNGVNEILSRLNETKRNAVTGDLIEVPLLHRLSSGALNRMVVDLPGILAGDPAAEVELQDGDEIIIPRRTEVAFVVGETASPFASFKVNAGMKVKDILGLAGGVTRNADVAHIRLLKADGRIVDSWVRRKTVEPGDAVLVPQRVRRDVSWQENLTALTPLAVMINALRR